MRVANIGPAFNDSPSQLVRPEDRPLFAHASVDDVAAVAIGGGKTTRPRPRPRQAYNTAPTSADPASERFFQRELSAHAKPVCNFSDSAQHRRRPARIDRLRYASARQRVGYETTFAVRAVVGGQHQLAAGGLKAIGIYEQLARSRTVKESHACATIQQLACTEPDR